MKSWILASLILAGVAFPASAERIKDIVDLKGVRGNPLQGYGVIVGLAGTGDNSPAAKRMLANILRRQNLVIDPVDLDSKNIAAVFVRAELGAFTGEGASVDVTVSSMGNATSLRGGTLLVTPLKGADGEVYAVAEGAVAVGGFSASGDSASVTKNHTTVGAIPSGAIVEKEEKATFVDGGEITLMLRNADFSTSKTIAEAISVVYPNSALAVDAGTVRVQLPSALSKSQVSEFISRIGEINVKVDSPAVVVIDEKTGTIVVGENVMVSTVAISMGSLSIVTSEVKSVSQPGPFTNTGSTEVTNQTNLKAIEKGTGLHVIPRQISVADLARALNAMGVSPSDLATIFRTIKAQGGLQAQLKTL